VDRLATNVAQDAFDQGHAFAATRLRATGPINAQGGPIVAGSSSLAHLALGQGIAEADIHRGYPDIAANDSQEHKQRRPQMRIIFIAKMSRANF